MTARQPREILMCCTQFDQELRSGSMSVTEVAPIAKRLGLGGIEYREVYWKNKPEELPRVREQLEEMHLKGIYATFTTLYSTDPAKRAQLLLDLADAHALGAPFMRVFRGDPPSEEPENDVVRAGARSVVDLACSYGMRLALENHSGAFGSHLTDVKGTLDQFHPSVMGTNVDVSNYVINDQDPLHAIKTLAPRIIYSHLKDLVATDQGLRQSYLGNGILPYGEILAALDAAGRDFPLCFEFGGHGDPEGSITKSLRFLQSLGYTTTVN